MLIVKDRNGQKGLISIETKYTDILGGNTAGDSVTRNALVEQGDFFGDELKNELRTNGCKQIHRNFLLTYACATKQELAHFANVVISPEEDKLSVAEVEELQSLMTQYQDRIFKIPLETVVDRGKHCGNMTYAEIINQFKDRYL